MTDKIGLVGCNILHAHNKLVGELNNLIHHQKRITVRKQLTDAVVIHHRLCIHIIDRRLYLIDFDILANKPRQLIVDLVSGAYGNQPPFDRFTDQSHITDDVQQLMACRFIGKSQLPVIQVAQLVGIMMRDVEFIGYIVQFVL